MQLATRQCCIKVALLERKGSCTWEKNKNSLHLFPKWSARHDNRHLCPPSKGLTTVRKALAAACSDTSGQVNESPWEDHSHPPCTTTVQGLLCCSSLIHHRMTTKPAPRWIAFQCSASVKQGLRACMRGNARQGIHHRSACPSSVPVCPAACLWRAHWSAPVSHKRSAARRATFPCRACQ